MLIALELNEVNFQAVEGYVKRGFLPNFKRLFDRHGFAVTTSEDQYELLEPWIQWVTAHTGKTFAEHGIFRLGDVLTADPVEQIWEHLEARGVKVGAISPMNADNRLKDAAYFVPDPWTASKVSGSWLLKRLYESISQAVNDNASERITLKSLFFLGLGALRYARIPNYFEYVKLAFGARHSKWNQALFLDLLLTDVFIQLQGSKSAQYATLFLNAAAHIQHHYMFASALYEGDQENPNWYVPKGADPVFDVYNLYDRILGQINEKFPEARLQILTGLHQTAYPATTYYWRLKNHEAFLGAMGVKFESVQPRMSRDFLVVCGDAGQAAQAAERIGRARAIDGRSIFTCDLRDSDVFVELTFDGNIEADFEYVLDNEVRRDLFENVAFVAIKNGEHHGDGYFLDTGLPQQAPQVDRIPLTSVFKITNEAFA
jgi:Type I phosphodiesterase / nucleotide pyrophosphatase